MVLHCGDLVARIGGPTPNPFHPLIMTYHQEHLRFLIMVVGIAPLDLKLPPFPPPETVSCKHNGFWHIFLWRSDGYYMMVSFLRAASDLAFARTVLKSSNVSATEPEQ